MPSGLTMDIDRDRLTEIAIEEENGERKFVGSGYVIGPGLVLTAAHVLFGAGDLVPTDLRIHVRVFSDLRRIIEENLEEFQGTSWLKLIGQALEQRGDQLCPAELIWPLPGKSQTQWDLALLAVTKGELGNTYHQFSNVELRPRDLSAELVCSAGGFPVWREHLAGPFKSPGLVMRTGNLTPTGLVYNPELTLQGDGPTDSKDWSGMSGGPVSISVNNEPTLIGVVQTAERSSDNRLLTIMMFPPYRSSQQQKPDPFGFWRAANRADQVDGAAPAAVARPVNRSRPADYIHIVDRQPHDLRILIGCEERYKNDSRKPAVILLHGRNVDDPTGYLDRWRSGDLEYKKLTGNVVQSNSGYLAWPNPIVGSIEQRLRFLRSAIVSSSIEAPASDASRNSNPPPKLGDDDPPERFREYFVAGRLPRTFSISLDAAQARDEDFELLSRLLEFFAAIAAVPDVVTLFITLVYKAAPGTSFIDVLPDSQPLNETASKVWSNLAECVARHENNLHVWNAGALTEIDSLTDIQDWRQKLERKNVRPTEGFFIKLKSQILATQTVPLADFSRFVQTSDGAS